jgi:predicted nucleotidyltransferase
MERYDTIAKLRAHETELRQLGVEHLYLFGSTARGEAREDSDVDLFFDHPEGSLGLYQLVDVKDTAARILGCKTEIMTAQLAPGSAGADRGLGAASVLMALPSPVPRLTDIVEAIEFIRSEMAGVTLQAFEPDKRNRWLAERGIEIASEASRHLSDELKAKHPGNSVAEGCRHRKRAAP